jgi:outer membrane protein OmpA-like peptidoglycan-associated protein
MIRVFSILLFILSISGSALSQTKVKSFYFVTNQVEPTIYSQNQFELLKTSFVNGDIQITEINAFTDSTGSRKSNDSLALKRLNYFANQLSLNPSIKQNAYALERPYVLEKSINNRRVDIFYTMSKQATISLGEIAVTENGKVEPISGIDTISNEHLINDPEIVLPTNIIGFENSLRSLTPLVLDIQFVEGKSKLLESSQKEVKRLADYLKENPKVKAEIRGHVCCGNNMAISKMRAKTVYKRLIHLGVKKNRLSFVGRSNLEPIVFPEKTNTDRQKNRRVDVIFSFPDVKTE